MNLPNVKWCEGITFNKPSNTSSSVLHPSAVSALLPCINPGFPWSTTADLIPTLPPPPLQETLPILSKIDSKSVLYSPNPGPCSNFFFKRSKQARASSSGSCPPSPLVWIFRPHHFSVSHLSPGLRGLPRGWWYMSAVSMHRGWHIWSALRSDSREWPSRMGVVVVVVWDADGDWFFEFEGEEKGFGFIEGGERSRRILAWTCDRVVVTVASASAVIPDHLQNF